MPHKNRAQALAKLLSGLAVNRVQGLNASSCHCDILDVVMEKLGLPAIIMSFENRNKDNNNPVCFEYDD